MSYNGQWTGAGARVAAPTIKGYDSAFAGTINQLQRLSDAEDNKNALAEERRYKESIERGRQKFQLGMQDDRQAFTSAENTANRSHTSTENTANRSHTSTENTANRTHTSTENGLNRGHQADMQAERLAASAYQGRMNRANSRVNSIRANKKKSTPNINFQKYINTDVYDKDVSEVKTGVHTKEEAEKVHEFGVKAQEIGSRYNSLKLSLKAEKPDESKYGNGNLSKAILINDKKKYQEKMDLLNEFSNKKENMISGQQIVGMKKNADETIFYNPDSASIEFAKKNTNATKKVYGQKKNASKTLSNLNNLKQMAAFELPKSQASNIIKNLQARIDSHNEGQKASNEFTDFKLKKSFESRISSALAQRKEELSDDATVKQQKDWNLKNYPTLADYLM